MKQPIRIASLFLLTLVATFMLGNQATRAQSIEILAIDTFNGAMNGAMLGGASMALQNTDDYYPVQFGVGMGTLGGLGIGVYDMTKASQGDNYYVNGVFNEATTTTTIMLLDTFYGGVTGALVGTSITLMSRQPIVEGLQYGTGAGIWAGFAFGVVDAFYLSKRVSGMVGYAPGQKSGAEGLLTYRANSSLSIGAISPAIYSYTNFSKPTPRYSTTTGFKLIDVEFKL